MAKKRYCVTIIRYGCLFVEADTEEKAMDIADHQLTDRVNWSDDWSPTDAAEDDSADDAEYITKRAY